MGRLSAGIGRMHPVTIRKASLMAGSIGLVWALRHQAGAQYSAVECTRAKVAVRNVVAPAPQPKSASRFERVTCGVSFFRSDLRCRRYVNDLSNVQWRTQKIFNGVIFYQWNMVVICICCSLFVTSQFDVIFIFPNQHFGEVCWDIMHILLHALPLIYVSWHWI